MIPFKIASAPVPGSMLTLPSYVSWGTSTVRVAGVDTYRREFDSSTSTRQDLRLTALASGTVGGSTEYDLRVFWELFDGVYSGVVLESGEFSVGHDYSPGDWIGLSCGLIVAVTSGTITADGTATITDQPRFRLSADYEELDLSNILFGESKTWPEFGILEEKDEDILRERTDGASIRVPVALKRDLWVNADALPVAYRRRLIRWVEEGRRLCVVPPYDRTTVLLLPLQNSLDPLVGPYPATTPPGLIRVGGIGWHQGRDGNYRPNRAGETAVFENMEPLGRGLSIVPGTASGWKNWVTAPSSPTSAGAFGWTIPGTDSGDFDPSVNLPVEGDPGALRWQIGSGSTGISRSVAFGSASYPYCFSVFLRGRSGETNAVTISTSPSGSMPKNTASEVLSGEWRRLFVVGVADGSGNATITITGSVNSVVFVCGAQAEPLGFGRYQGPTSYESVLDAAYAPRDGFGLSLPLLQVPSSQGRISGFFRPEFFGGYATARVYLIRGSSSSLCSIGVKDPSAAGTSLTFFGDIAGTEITETVTDWEDGEVFFVSFSWTAYSSAGYRMRLDVFSPSNPSGVGGVLTSGTTAAAGYGGLSVFSQTTAPAVRAVSLLRYDYGSSYSQGVEATWASDQYSFWTSEQTKEIGKITIGREFELALGAMVASAGNPNYIDAALRLVERRVRRSAAIGGDER